MYKTKFYARTWMLWAGMMMSGFFTFFSGIMAVLFYFGFMTANNGSSGRRCCVKVLIVFWQAESCKVVEDFTSETRFGFLIR